MLLKLKQLSLIYIFYYFESNSNNLDDYFRVIIYKNKMLKLNYLMLALYLEVVYLSSSCFYSHFFTIFNGESNVKNWATWPGYSFSLTWKNPQLQIISHSYTLAGFKINSPNKILSYSSSLQSVTQSGARFLYNPTQNNSQIVSAQFTIILLKSCGVPLHVGQIELPLTILNMPNRPADFENFNNLPISNPLPYGIHSTGRAFLSSVQLSSFTNYSLSFTVLSVGNTSFSLKVTSSLVDGCIFTKIKVTYVFLSRQLTLKYDFLYTTHTRDQANIEFRPQKGFFPNGTNNCFVSFFSISLINLSASSSHVTLAISNEIKGPVLYSVSTNTANVNYSNVMVCLSQCSETQFPDYSIGTGSCSPCSDLMDYCYSCNSSGYCLSCLSGYYLHTTMINTTCVSCFAQCHNCFITNSCLLCSKSRTVKGGCSVDPGCIQINSALSYLDNNCIACNIGDNLVLANGTCKCKLGYSQINSLCVQNTVGCTAAVKKNSTISCYLCNQYLGFMPYSIDGKCVCKSGYKIIDQSCIEICSDGIRSNHQCDDGNLVSGDGCTADCLIESDFDCYGNLTAPSICIYLKENIKLEVISITKVPFKNIGIFKLKLSPNLGIYNRINTSSINFSTNKSYFLVQISFDQNEILVQVEYKENLEGFPAEVQLNLGQPFFLQQIVTITFNMISNNSKLIVAQNQQKLVLLTVIFEVISWAVLVLFVVSMFVHKMIGLELLQSIQIIYFVHLINRNYTSPFSVFMFLANLGYNFLFIDDVSSNIDSSKLNVEFDPQNYTLSQIILSALIIIPVTVTGIMLLFSNEKQSLQQKSSKESIKTEEKIGDLAFLIYNRIVFPLSIGSMFLFFLVLGTKSRNSNNSLILGFAIILSAISLSKIYFTQLRSLFVDSNQHQFSEVPNCERRYIGFYLIIQLIHSIVFVISFRIQQVTPQYYLAPIYFILIILMLIYQPYKNRIHNLGAIFCMVTSFSFLLWCIFRDAYQDLLMEEAEINAILIFLVLFLLSIILSVWRTTFQLKNLILRKCYKKQLKTKPVQKIHSLEECKQPFHIQQINIQELNWKQHQVFLIKNTYTFYNFFDNIPQKYFLENSTINSGKGKNTLEKKKYFREKIAKKRESSIDS